MKDWMDIG